MYLIVIAWFYVTAMMAVVEAASPQGSLLGACITFGLYGLLPMGLLIYILGTPQRKRTLRQRQAAEQRAYDETQAVQTEQAAQETAETAKAANLSAPADASGHAPAATQCPGIAPVREKQ